MKVSLDIDSDYAETIVTIMSRFAIVLSHSTSAITLEPLAFNTNVSATIAGA